MITGCDFFCGSGGSTTGLQMAGIEIRYAVNHIAICIETHAANYPKIDHDQTDIQKVDMARYPNTDMAWLSPECTNITNAKGQSDKIKYENNLWGERIFNPAEQRSRLTMFEVYRYAQSHSTPVIIVENVTDIFRWPLLNTFLAEMSSLEYQYQIVSLNAQFFNVAQNRDRAYIVFWKNGHPKPALDFKPPAECPQHGTVNSLQSWKNGHRGYDYGASYVYVCPHCGIRLEPMKLAARSIIDWSIPVPLVRDRRTPLVPATRQRIAQGLQRFRNEAHLLTYYSREHTHSSLNQPLPTIRTSNSHTLSVPPPLIDSCYGKSTRLMNANQEPLGTITTRQHHALVEAAEWGTAVDNCGYRFLNSDELKRGQSFPNRYILLGNQEERIRMIGNAVACHVAEWLGRQVIQTFQ